MKTMSLKISEELEEKIERAVRRHRLTKSEIVRQALERFVREEPAPPPPSSALALLEDLAGCLEGPPDLSTNEEHLEGYGR
jgi:Arc/MetJ-type ribon-helix-helix transcriptional regulator